jgi:hypothetical protein
MRSRSAVTSFLAVTSLLKEVRLLELDLPLAKRRQPRWPRYRRTRRAKPNTVRQIAQH